MFQIKKRVVVTTKMTPDAESRIQDRVQAWAELLAFAEKENQGWTPDFYQPEQAKYFFGFNHARDCVEVNVTWKNAHGQICFRDEKAIKKALRELGARTIKIALGFDNE